MRRPLVQRRRAGATKSPRGAAAPVNPTAAPTASASISTSIAEVATQPTAKPSRYISAAVLRAVWLRDQSRCAFVGTSGKRCDSTHQLQVHLKPFARGGVATEDNLGLRCRQHNVYEAELDFGADFMRSLPFWKCEDSRVPGLLLPGDPPSVEDASTEGAPSTSCRSFRGPRWPESPRSGAGERQRQGHR